MKHNRNEVKYVSLITLNIISGEYNTEFHGKYHHVLYNISDTILKNFSKFHPRAVLQTIRLPAQFNADCEINVFQGYSDSILNCLRNMMNAKEIN